MGNIAEVEDNPTTPAAEILGRLQQDHAPARRCEFDSRGAAGPSGADHGDTFSGIGAARSNLVQRAIQVFHAIQSLRSGVSAIF